MKRRLLAQLVLASLLSPLTFFGVFAEVQVTCPPKFQYDPNLVEYKLLGGISLVSGETMVVDVNAYDPDGDPLTVNVLNGPTGLVITPDPFKLQWTPMGIGLWYVNIEAKDQPEDPNQSLTTRGTVVIRVLKRNKPPVIGPLCGG